MWRARGKSLLNAPIILFTALTVALCIYIFKMWSSMKKAWTPALEGQTPLTFLDAFRKNTISPQVFILLVCFIHLAEEHWIKKNNKKFLPSNNAVSFAITSVGCWRLLSWTLRGSFWKRPWAHGALLCLTTSISSPLNNKHMSLQRTQYFQGSEASRYFR